MTRKKREGFNFFKTIWKDKIVKSATVTEGVCLNLSENFRKLNISEIFAVAEGILLDNSDILGDMYLCKITVT